MKRKMLETTKADFFSRIGGLNVHPRPERDRTLWETPAREIIGMSTPGYMREGPPRYWLADEDETA